MGELQPSAGLDRYSYGLFQGQLVIGSGLYDSLNVTPGHEFGDHVGLPLVIAKVEDGHDMWMGAESPHRLRLARDACSGYLVQTLGLDEGKSNVSVQQLIVGKVDHLLAALSEESFDDVATTCE